MHLPLLISVEIYFKTHLCLYHLAALKKKQEHWWFLIICRIKSRIPEKAKGSAWPDPPLVCHAGTLGTLYSGPQGFTLPLPGPVRLQRLLPRTLVLHPPSAACRPQPLPTSQRRDPPYSLSSHCALSLQRISSVWNKRLYCGRPNIYPPASTITPQRLVSVFDFAHFWIPESWHGQGSSTSA